MIAPLARGLPRRSKFGSNVQGQVQRRVFQSFASLRE
jgi:hypothetical protein